jgi:hypothetical protein
MWGGHNLSYLGYSQAIGGGFTVLTAASRYGSVSIPMNFPDFSILFAVTLAVLERERL